MHLRLFANPDLTSLTTILSLCALSDSLELFRSKNIEKYWTSYVHGNLIMLKEFLASPGLICWVVETDIEDQVGSSSGEPGESEHSQGVEKGKGGEVVGWIIWERTGESNVARHWRMGKDGWGNSLNHALLSLQNKYITYFNPTINHRNAALVQQNRTLGLSFPESWHIHALYISPSYQRRGLGTLAVKWGIGQADCEAVPIVVDSSSKGVALYERMGFVKVEQQFKEMEFADETRGLGMWKLVKEPKDTKISWIDEARKRFEIENPK